MASIIWNPNINAYNPTVEMTVTQQSQDIAGNYSTLAYSLVIHRPYSISSTAAKAYSVVINGVTVASGTTTIGGSGDKVICSGTTLIYHSSDGSSSAVPFSFTQAIAITWSGTATGNASGSGSISLTTIPRASTITSITGGALGSPVVVVIARASSTFTHTVVYRRTNGTDVNVGTSIGTSCTFTPALSDCSLLPSATSGTATIIVHTYKSTTLIGTTSTTFTVTVPTGVVPIISGVAITEGVTGIAAQFGAFVQNRSKLSASISTTQGQSSPIVSWTSTLQGSSYSGATFTSNPVTASGILTIRTTVKDSRGRSAVKDTDVTVTAYTTPSISTFNAVRSLATGVESIEEGTSLKAVMAFNVASVGSKNTKSWKLEYRLAGGTWSPVTSGSVYAYSSTHTSAAGLLGLDSSYEARLTVADWFTSTSATMPISTAFVLMDFAANGRGVAIGKVASGNGVLDVQGDVVINGVLQTGSGTMPVGDGSLAYWHSVRQGKYFCRPGDITSQPSSYGFVDVFKAGTTEFNVIWYTQSSGAIYRKSGNASTQTGWIVV